MAIASSLLQVIKNVAKHAHLVCFNKMHFSQGSVCRKLEAMAIYLLIVNQACGRDIWASVYLYNTSNEIETGP